MRRTKKFGGNQTGRRRSECGEGENVVEGFLRTKQLAFVATTSAEMLVSYVGTGAWREGLLLEHGNSNDRHPGLDRPQTQAESLLYAAVD